jgi:GNAT superfamily N-acetyltransferase
MTGLAPDELTLAIEHNVEDVFRLVACHYPGAVITDSEGVLRYSTDVSHLFGNVVVRTRLDDTVADEVVRDVVADHRRRDMPMMWFVSPSSQPSRLAQMLQSAGGRATSPSPGMAADLTGISTQIHFPDGVRVEEVVGPASLNRWVHTLTEAFDLPETVGKMFAIQNSQFRPFLAYLDGKPVATSALFVADGVAGIYCVGTKAEARRRGIGTVITHAPLLEARKQGCRYAILQSSELGLNVYKQLGFVEQCQFLRYVFNVE